MSESIAQMMNRPSQVISKTYVSNEYYLYLHGDIGEPDEFMEHFALYRQAGPQDLVFLYINSNGGSLATGMEYVRHMRDCEAPIVAVLGMQVASMASAIALEADDLIVDEMSTMLVHGFSYGAAGNEFSVFNQAAFNKKLNERWVRGHYSNFLEESQILDALRGVDILLDSEEIQERWNQLKEYRAVVAEEGCGNPDCEDCNPEDEEPRLTFDEMMAEIASKASEETLKKIKASFDLTPKPEKPKRSTKPKITEEESQ